MTTPFAVVFWAMMVAYALAVGGQIAAVVLRAPRWARPAQWAAGAALVVHTLLVGWRWIETGHIPVIGNFENALFGGWFIAAMTAWAGWRERYPIVAAAALPFALLVLGGGALSDSSPSPLVASLNSSWLYIHIFFAWLAYGAYTVACGAGIVYLAKTRTGRAPDDDQLGRLDELMFRSTAFGFVTDAIMIAAGAIWAKDLWGSYWSWDPVETWSLLSWVIYGLVLHLRTTLGWRGRPVAWILVFAVVTVIITFWGVNLVMAGSSHVFNVG
jgi:ABC-type transport system involved in cytochrome c biogenesis permease subunit